MMSTQVVVIGDVSGKCSTWMAGPTPILLWQSRASHKVVWDAHGNEIHYSVQTMITGIWRLELQESANKEMLSVKLTFQQWDLSLQFVFWRWIDKPICLDVGSRWRHSLFTHCWLYKHACSTSDRTSSSLQKEVIPTSCWVQGARIGSVTFTWRIIRFKRNI